MIRALEESGKRPARRSTRRIDSQKSGERSCLAAQRALAAAETGRDAVAGVRGLVRGQLAIGAIQNVGPVNILAFLARYHHRHPAVTLRLHHDRSAVARTQNRRRRTRTCDRRSTSRSSGQPRQDEPIGSEALLLGVAANDPLAHRTRARLIDLADRAFVEYRSDSSLRASIDQTFQAAGLKRRIVCEVDAMPDLVELVALGVGIALLPPRALQLAGDRAVGLTTDPSITRELLLVTPLDREPSPAAAAFVELFDPEP